MLHHGIIKHLIINAPQLFDKHSEKRNKYDEINKPCKGFPMLLAVYET